MVLIKQNDFVQYKFENKIPSITTLKRHNPPMKNGNLLPIKIMSFYDVDI